MFESSVSLLNFNNCKLFSITDKNRDRGVLKCPTVIVELSDNFCFIYFWVLLSMYTFKIVTSGYCIFTVGQVGIFMFFFPGEISVFLTVLELVNIHVLLRRTKFIKEYYWSYYATQFVCLLITIHNLSFKKCTQIHNLLISFSHYL